MSTANLNPAPSAKPTVTGLGHKTVHGFAWMTAQALGSKVVGMLSQIVLAWLLSKEDFGQIGLAYTVTAFVGLIVNPGIGTVLIQRSHHMRRWATSAFWMSLTFGILGAVIMLIAAPVGAAVYHSPQLLGLISILAISAPLGTLNTVPNAILASQMRFKLTSVMGAVLSIFSALLTILFAALGFKAYSFVLPMPIMVLASAAVLWSITRPRIQLRLQLRRWKYLVGDSAFLFLSGLCSTAISQGDYITLGLMYPLDVVGVYFFGFNLANQGLRLVAINFSGVLFPALNQLNSNPPRQAEAALRAARVLAFISVPLCFLQAIAAEPAIRMLYGSKWAAAVPVVQILCLGMAIDSIAWVGGALLNAQGLYRVSAMLAVGAVPVFYLCVVTGSWLGQSVGAAAGVSVYYAIYPTTWFCLVLRWRGINLRRVLALYPAPFGISAVSAIAAVLAGQLVPIGRWNAAGQTAVIVMVMLLVYLALCRILTPILFWEAKSLVLRLILR